MTKFLTHEYLKSILDYNPDTGLFVWKNRSFDPSGIAKKFHKCAGYKEKTGYIRITIDYQIYAAHRLAWLCMTGHFPDCDIDHINLDKSDNRFCNLRLATKSQNSANKTKMSNNKSGYKGVSFLKSSQKWVAEIVKDGVRYFLGSFDDPIQAYKAYCKKSVELYGSFSRVE